MLPLVAFLLFVPPDGGSIEGRVLNKTSEQPIRRAQVRLFFVGPNAPRPDHGMYTDEEGRFRFTDVAPGRYRLRVEKSGFLSQDVLRTGRAGAPVLEVTAGNTIGSLTIRLVQTSVITGRVRDQLGEPMAHVSIEVLQQSFDLETGNPRWAPASSGFTNDLGEYRLFGLKPAKYFIRLMPNRPNELETYAPLFHPGVREMEQATQLDLKSGTVTEGIDFTLAPVPAVNVRGRVTNLKNPVSGRLGGSVTLFARNDLGLRTPVHSTAPAPNGHFEIRGVVPGTYLLHAIEYGQESQMQVRETLNVGNTDLEGLTLTLQEGGGMTGTIRWETAADPKAPTRRLPLWLRARDNEVPMGRQYYQSDPDGSFVFKNVLPGVYDIQAGPVDGYYLKAVRQAGRDVTEAGVPVPSGGSAAQVEIILAKATGKLEGNVHDGDQAAPDSMVILLASEAHRGVPAVRQVFTDSQGHFSLDQLVAGQYLLLSLEGTEAARGLDPDVRKTFSDRVESIEIKDNTTVKKDLKLIPSGDR